MTTLEHKVIWITGAGTGIGRAGAEMFAAEGAHVCLLGRRTAKLDEVREAIESRGGKASTARCDVGDRAEVTKVASQLLSTLGRVDILVNNAGTNLPGDARALENLTPEGFDELIRINLTGQFNMFHAVFAPMRSRGEGLVINVISTAAKAPSGVAGLAYQTSKHGFMGLGVSLVKEAWKFGIRTCNIYPDETNTEILSRRPKPFSAERLAKLIQPEDLAHALRFVATLDPRCSVTELTLYPTAKGTGWPAD